MRVTLRLGGGLGGRAWWPPRELEVEEGTTLIALLGRLDKRVLADLGRSNTLIVLNGRRVAQRDEGLELHDGDVVAVVAASAGG